MDYETLRENVQAIATQFAERRPERQLRRHLDPADFAQLRDAGLPLVGVPQAVGGLFVSAARSTRPIAELLRCLARADSSVALVCSMHPAVLSYWLTAPHELAADPIWRQQCQEIFQSVLDGHWWGTITSEPGSGGDITRTRAIATREEGEAGYFLTGEKHFGSGTGLMAFMVTTAVPTGEQQPDWFFVDLRNQRWDGSRGVRLVAEWDGQGMTATQSHSLSFENFPATRMAWPGHLLEVAKNAGGLIGCLFTSVIVGICDEAFRLAEQHLAGRTLEAFEQTEWTRARIDYWLLQQALEGMYRAVESQGDPRQEVLLGKTAVAELSETLLTRLCRVLGGSTLNRRSPFGCWLADVRALGFLRPPWPLAFKTLANC